MGDRSDWINGSTLLQEDFKRNEDCLFWTLDEKGRVWDYFNFDLFEVISGSSMPFSKCRIDWLWIVMDYLTSCLKGCGSVLSQLRGMSMLEGGNASK